LICESNSLTSTLLLILVLAVVRDYALRGPAEGRRAGTEPALRFSRGAYSSENTYSMLLGTWVFSSGVALTNHWGQAPPRPTSMAMYAARR
jgi:hypothetical protein